MLVVWQVSVVVSGIILSEGMALDSFISISFVSVQPFKPVTVTV
jgi:hypothetical protein